MKTTQYIGLNEQGNILLGSIPPEFQTREEGNFVYLDTAGFEHKLSKYILDDGTIYQEKVQAIFFLSGPVIFTKLVDSNGKNIKKSIWSKEEMEGYL